MVQEHALRAKTVSSVLDMLIYDPVEIYSRSLNIYDWTQGEIETKEVTAPS